MGSFDGTVYAADLATGKLRWRYDTEGHGLDSKDFGFDRKSIQSSPAVVDGTVYIGARDGYLYALDASAGKLRWRIPYSMSWIISSPAVTGGLVYVGTSDGHYFQAVQAADGKERWRFRTRSSVWTSAALAGDVVYVGESAGLVYALDRNTGALRWKFRTGGPVFSSPVPGEGVVVFGSVDGAVYAVRDGGGNPLARAVFFDSAFADRSGASARKFVADYLAGRDYAPVDAAGLAGFLSDRIRDRRPSVVVFAVDELPAAAAAGSPALLRRYLNAGGKVVWVGVPPLIWPPDSTGGRDYAHIDREATRRLLDVDHARANFDLFGARITDVGRRWGLRGWQLSRWGWETPRSPRLR